MSFDGPGSMMMTPYQVFNPALLDNGTPVAAIRARNYTSCNSLCMVWYAQIHLLLEATGFRCHRLWRKSLEYS
ncbi:hypothetical protein TNCV_2923111 [Trichonephila clavipes]|nr:hypothetical protein TNCV_2923111 [Trichonephila clavipes]